MSQPFDPANDVRDILPGYDRIGERTVRHDRVLLVCSQCGSAATVEVSDERQSILICAECGDDGPGVPAECDDCYRTDGTHDPEVEH